MSSKWGLLRMANWEKIRHEWVSGSDDVTFAALAIRFKIKRTTIAKRASRESWMRDRKAYRQQVDAEAIQIAKKHDILSFSDRITEDLRIYDQVVGKGVADMSGIYPDGVDPKKGQRVYPPTLLVAMRDRRKLYEHVYGKEPIPDQTYEVGLNLIGFDMSKILGKKFD